MLIKTLNFFSIVHVVLIQYVTIRQTVHAQSIYYINPKKLHGSGARDNLHQASRFRNIKINSYSCSSYIIIIKFCVWTICLIVTYFSVYIMPAVVRTNGKYFGIEINFSVSLNPTYHPLKPVSYSQMGELDDHINVPNVWP